MPIGIIFWAIMLIILIYMLLGRWQRGVGIFAYWNDPLVYYILLFLLGWGLFGPPIRG